MKLDDAIAKVNAAIKSKGLPTRITSKLDGLALTYKVQATSQAPAQQINLLALGNEPVWPDDNFDVHVFHLMTGGEFTPSEYKTGRTKEQTQKTQLTLIGYTNQRPFLDYLLETLGSLDGVELRKLELSPARIEERYLFGEKQVESSGPRQLFAVNYLLDVQPPLGGGRCPKFTW
jgi:hypothetical protein